jgi:molybdopterin biosynthesis enzyme
MRREGHRFGPVPIDDAVGKVLGHNVADASGRRALRKGRPISPDDVAVLREMGRRQVYVALPGPDDVEENRAAERIARAAAGAGVRLTAPAAARVNALSDVLGVLRVDAARLTRVNACDGVSLATLPPHSAVHPGQLVATVKVIPYFLPAEILLRAEALASEAGPLVRVDPVVPTRVSLILSGSPPTRERVTADFEAPLRDRVEALGSTLEAVDFVALDDETGEAALAHTLRRRLADGAGLVVLSGETAVVDRYDIAPRAIERAGGEVVCFGAPVDPGNLLLVAYVGGVPILGAPGCARSRKTNVIDWVLPRLLAGERLTRDDVVALGAGGLLEDVPERPMPRVPAGENQD